MDTYQKQVLQKEIETGCNWEYDPISRQLIIRNHEDVSIYDEGAIQLLKDQLPPAEADDYRPASVDDEYQFSEEIYDEHSSSLYIFLSIFWRKKEEEQEMSVHAIAC
jgi:hypothetical protein